MTSVFLSKLFADQPSENWCFSLLQTDYEAPFDACRTSAVSAVVVGSGVKPFEKPWRRY